MDRKLRPTGVIKACIFDLDGVIVDTAHYHYLAWKRLADELGHHLTEQENERLKGVSRMQSLDIILDLAGISLNGSHKQMLADKKNGWFNDYLERMLPDEVYPGVKKLITDLKSSGIKVALASSSKNARRVVHLLKIQHDFDVIVDGTMITHAKPDPEIFLRTAEKLGVDPGDCLVFEDAVAGVEAAFAAGMKCVGIGSSLRLHKANKVFSTTSEFKLSTLRELEMVNN